MRYATDFLNAAMRQFFRSPMAERYFPTCSETQLWIAGGWSFPAFHDGGLAAPT